MSAEGILHHLIIMHAWYDVAEKWWGYMSTNRDEHDSADMRERHYWSHASCMNNMGVIPHEH